MLTGEKRSQIDKIWNAFWTGGVSNPLTVIEQITYLLFIKRLDELQAAKELKANRLNKAIEAPIFDETQQELRWSYFKDREADDLYRLFTKEEGVFDFMKNMGQENSFSRFMKGATFMIPTSRLLTQVADLLSDVSMTSRDAKGDIYEYLLSKIATAGTNGQFRTPRHIIKMMVDMMQPTPQDTICDPSAGTCGFLVASAEYIQEHYEERFITDSDFRKHFNEDMFIGTEFDATMIRIGSMNMLMHGIEKPNLVDVDALSEGNSGFVNKASLVLANPPFKGSLDHDAVEKNIISIVSSKKTELLFLGLILRGLKIGGRAAVIVPDGVLFGSSKAHVQIRKAIIEEHQLKAVISMPSGVFKPYAGVSTAILIFSKTNSGGTDNVWFYDMQADGYSLDDKRQETPENNDIADIVARYHNLAQEQDRKRTDKSFFVPLNEIQVNNYDLSINRYKEVIHEEKHYEKPAVILEKIHLLDIERQKGLSALEALLKI
ncbi:type I restriction enzyme M protein [Pseudarcicella hirudinis]|uniref:site-specific DNA-methyltransferase (adenine-specific) n=2 Tax=Pseudarcicella hirudinis TaxID=1079859 RepID=A0A1I5U8B2_9BACT|nr:class I SAM-dependent DNA methyltransferase [Pseudarcicella hirudinis]SFP90856.1 type I restriction enzyme M protein [Pseudarcicella hirudinis]